MKTNTLTVVSEDETHIVELPKGIRSVEVDGQELLEIQASTKEVKRLLKILIKFACIGITMGIFIMMKLFCANSI